MDGVPASERSGPFTISGLTVVHQNSLYNIYRIHLMAAVTATDAEAWYMGSLGHRRANQVFVKVPAEPVGDTNHNQQHQFSYYLVTFRSSTGLDNSILSNQQAVNINNGNIDKDILHRVSTFHIHTTQGTETVNSHRAEIVWEIAVAAVPSRVNI